MPTSLEDSQFRARLEAWEDRLNRLEQDRAADHDVITILDTKMGEMSKSREKGGDRMWSVILIGIGVLVQVAGAIVTLAGKH